MPYYRVVLSTGETFDSAVPPDLVMQREVSPTPWESGDPDIEIWASQIRENFLVQEQKRIPIGKNFSVETDDEAYEMKFDIEDIEVPREEGPPPKERPGSD